MNKVKISAIITSGGNSTRFGSNKLLEKIDEKSVIETTILKFLDLVDEIIVPSKEDIKNHILKSKIYCDKIKFAPAGKTRQNSVYNGLVMCSSPKIVLIHDGARPFIDKETIKKALEDAYNNHLEKEIKLKSTLYGPHRDDFSFNIEDNNLREFGSQGQQKMAIIALKLSEIEVFKDFKQTSPIILLDDVFSDLDNKKKNNLLKHIKGDMQVIITTTDLDSIDEKLLSKAKLIHIENGQILENEVKK